MGLRRGQDDIQKRRWHLCKEAEVQREVWSFLSGVDAEDRNPGRGTEAWTCVTRASWQLPEVAASCPCCGPPPHSHSLGHLHCHPEQEGLTLTGISQLGVVKKRRLSGTSEKRISQLWMPKGHHFRPHPAIGPYRWVGMEES